MNQEQFIKKAKDKHNNEYDYSKVEYVDSTTKICIICPKHGEFWQVPASHLRGQKCPKCANENRGRYKKLSNEDFILKAKEIHDNKYDYSKVNYINSSTDVEIICPTHGSFLMTPLAHIYGKQGCPKCVGRNLNTDDIIKLFREKHGDKYDYSKVVFEKMHEKVCIICQAHGEFWQTPSKHLLGQGCPSCSVINRSNEKKLTTDEFILKAKEIHGDKYNYQNTVYNGTYEEVSILCPTHGEFKQRANDHLSGHGCPHCGVIISKFEDEVETFIKSLGFNIQCNCRNILPNKQEIDIFIPELNIGIECDGLKWHSSEFKENNYHHNKTKLAEENGIRLIHIFEDEWLNKQNIVKDILQTILNKNNNRIFARKCEIRELENKDVKIFVNENHIQGHINAKHNIGLFYNSELISVMSFGAKRINLGHKKNIEGEYELLRYCVKNNLTVVGGAKKLFNYFIRKYQPSQIISYCDRRYFTGNLYCKLGFELDHISQPNYYYVLGNNRQNRYKYRKSELIKMGYDETKTETEIMKEKNIYRIYDCGNYVFKFDNHTLL